MSHALSLSASIAETIPFRFTKSAIRTVDALVVVSWNASNKGTQSTTTIMLKKTLFLAVQFSSLDSNSCWCQAMTTPINTCKTTLPYSQKLHWTRSWLRSRHQLATIPTCRLTQSTCSRDSTKMATNSLIWMNSQTVSAQWTFTSPTQKRMQSSKDLMLTTTTRSQWKSFITLLLRTFESKTPPEAV